jgi:TPR repeat protein
MLEVKYPTITRRNYDDARKWYDKLMATAYEAAPPMRLLLKVYSLARQRGYVQGAAPVDPASLQQVLLDAVIDDAELLEMLLGVESYPATKQACDVAIEWLRQWCGVERDDWDDVPLQEIADTAAHWLRSFRAATGL